MTPIRDLIALIVARVLDTRLLFSLTDDEAPVPVDPEDERVERAFAEPEAGE